MARMPETITIHFELTAMPMIVQLAELLVVEDVRKSYPDMTHAQALEEAHTMGMTAEELDASADHTGDSIVQAYKIVLGLPVDGFTMTGTIITEQGEGA